MDDVEGMIGVGVGVDFGFEVEVEAPFEEEEEDEEDMEGASSEFKPALDVEADAEAEATVDPDDVSAEKCLALVLVRTRGPVVRRRVVRKSMDDVDCMVDNVCYDSDDGGFGWVVDRGRRV